MCRSSASVDDPRVFSKRAFEVFGDEVEFIFAKAIDYKQPLDSVSNCWFNRVFRPSSLERYNRDRIGRPYAYSK